MLEDIMKESSFYDYALEEGIQQGIKRIAHDAVMERFPDVSPDVLTRIDALTVVDTLRQIALKAATLPDLAALSALIDSAQTS